MSSAAQLEGLGRAHSVSADLASVEHEAGTFLRLRVLTIMRSLRQTMQRSRLRLSLVVLLTIFFWAGLFLLFYHGFSFLSVAIGHPTTHAQTVQAIYNVFFISLMMMLVLSSSIIIYGGLYCTPEAGLLLSMPIRPERIVLHKFQEAVLFSSWGFLLLGTPMLIAYGVVANSPWYYFALVLPFMMSFIYIPGSAGALICLLLVHKVPRLRLQTLTVVLVLGIGLAIFAAWSIFGGTESNMLTPMWFQEMLSRLQFSEHRLLPSWWLSSGLLEAARPEMTGLDRPPWAESVMYLTLLVSNALVCHLAVVWAGSRWYRVSYSEISGVRTLRRPRRDFWLDRLVPYLMPMLNQQMRLLFTKDLRLFRRDPLQWSQFLIFFGLLGLYFMNIRRFSYDGGYLGWVNMISFLNLAVVGLILSTFTTRFIFPMISLEGRRFWILGLLPINRDTILWGKFVFASVGSLVPCGLLILLSDLMLRISSIVVVIHQLTCFMLCIGLSGIAVGLGAKMPDLNEQSPSKIAAGFGGTLNLVLSALYIVAIVLLAALPCHFQIYLAANNVAMNTGMMHFWSVGGAVAAVLLSLLATVAPMWIGLRAFRRLEF